MAENQGLERTLEKLVELLSAKVGATASSGHAIVSHIEPVQKIELMPNDIKLEGVRNYLSWSKRALLLLKAKGLEGLISRKWTEPSDKDSAEWKTWDATNSLVAAWLLSSMTPTIAASVDSLINVADIWESVSRMYSGAGNVMLLAETEDRINESNQGERPLMEYVVELQRLWADVDHYDPINLPHPECVAWVRKWIENRRVLQFLRGLNPELEARRATMFHQPILPSLEEAIAAMAQEEARLKVMRSITPSPARSAFIATRGTILAQETRICYNCGEKGHLIRDCRQPLKPNRGRGRGPSRGASRGGGRSYRANLAVTQEDMATNASGGNKPSLLSTLPQELPLEFFKEITNGFSDDRKLSEGAFGTVYKGILEDGQLIAVKKLAGNTLVPAGNQFLKAATNLMVIQHENILKLLSCCSEAKKKVVEHKGKYILVDTDECVLCYENAPKGSLYDYLSDDTNRADWDISFKIIKGICQGLHFLHQEIQFLHQEMGGPIVHLDLQPANILLDDNMVPKLRILVFHDSLVRSKPE